MEHFNEKGLKNIVVGKVVAIEPHIVKDSNLRIIRVDVGNTEPIQIVSNFSNEVLNVNQLIVVALEKAKLYLHKKTYRITIRKIQGVDTYGKILTSAELFGRGFWKDAFPATLTGDIKVGTPIIDIFNKMGLI